MVDSLNDKISVSTQKLNTLNEELLACQEEIRAYNHRLISDAKLIVKEFISLYRKYQDQNVGEYVNLCKDFLQQNIPELINALETHLKNYSKSSAAKVVLYKTIGDYKRYMVELNYDKLDMKGTYIQEAMITYQEGIQASQDMAVNDPNRVGLYLNYMVLLADEVRNIDLAISIGEKVDKELTKFYAVSDEGKDMIDEIWSIIKNNLVYFKKNRDLYTVDAIIK